MNYAQDNWVKLLPSAKLAFNCHDSVTIGVSPFFLTHGYNPSPLSVTEEPRNHENQSPRSPIEQAEAIVQNLRRAAEWAQSAMALAQQRQEDHANRYRGPAFQYYPRDKVWLNLKNISIDRPSRTLGERAAQFTVIEPVGSHAYRLDTPPGVHDVFHTSLLRPAARDPLPSQTTNEPQNPALIREAGEPEEYEVEAILRDRELRGHKQYLVKWTGWRKPTWEPASAMADTIALDRYEAS